MRHFASDSARAKVILYPAEVSRVLAKVIGVKKESKEKQTIYDQHVVRSLLLK
jgi:type I restriction enzyme M protein